MFGSGKLIIFAVNIDSESDETEETKNKIRGVIWSLLVCLPGPAGRRNPEISDTGRLFRVIRSGGDFADTVGYSPYSGRILPHKRIGFIPK